ncbi:hypothetical protein GCM10019071_38080 [Sphingobium fuliginis]|uniref:Uncharacterized protein n=1 Tax=Sphingobium fuliginis (strain ATCC 27551) TaxID=336203 RepID=A0ABQ1F8V8_SPHSA|nr:hypothetical protein GCM10019071_38080 [Sphingobium fuliginis]
MAVAESGAMASMARALATVERFMSLLLFLVPMGGQRARKGILRMNGCAEWMKRIPAATGGKEKPAGNNLISIGYGKIPPMALAAAMGGKGKRVTCGSRCGT